MKESSIGEYYLVEFEIKANHIFSNFLTSLWCLV